MAEFFPNIPKIEYDPKSKNPGRKHLG